MLERLNGWSCWGKPLSAWCWGCCCCWNDGRPNCFCTSFTRICCWILIGGAAKLSCGRGLFLWGIAAAVAARLNKIWKYCTFVGTFFPIFWFLREILHWKKNIWHFWWCYIGTTLYPLIVNLCGYYLFIKFQILFIKYYTRLTISCMVSGVVLDTDWSLPVSPSLPQPRQHSIYQPAEWSTLIAPDRSYRGGSILLSQQLWT